MEVTIYQVDKFISKKGNPCAWIWFITKDSPIPFKWLCFTQDKVNNLPSVGQSAKLTIDRDNNLVGMLQLTW